MKKIKDSKIEIMRVVEEGVDKFGKKFKKVRREILDRPLEMGSINKPLNADVLSFKIEVPAED